MKLILSAKHISLKNCLTAILLEKVHLSLQCVLEVLNHIDNEQDRGPPYVLTVIYQHLSFYAPFLLLDSFPDTTPPL